MQTGPGLWVYNLQEVVPVLPIMLKVNDALLLVVGVAGAQQLTGQIWRTLFTAPSVWHSLCMLLLCMLLRDGGFMVVLAWQ